MTRASSFAARQASEARVRAANLASLAAELGVPAGSIQTEWKMGEQFAVLPDGSRRCL